MSDNNTIYVSLDLGSESMAAYYEDAYGVGGMIKLQARAHNFLGMTEPAANDADSGIDFLTEESANGSASKKSARLWNRISFRDMAQPRILPDDHARLLFTDKAAYERSIFEIFHPKGGWPPARIMPNPKILFQHQVKDILKGVGASDGGTVDLSPEQLIKHLSLQVILNLVLGSQELRDFNQSDIHLTITIPNIYSLPHAESIKEFVRANTSIGIVDIISESEAIAYYVLSAADANDPADLREFKAELQETLIKRKALCIVTFDVGKGTTDLSCVLKQQPKDVNPSHQGLISRLFKTVDVEVSPAEPRKLRHSVQGRTGKSSGGNHLNYLFASFYDKRLRAAAEAIRDSTRHSIPFYFLKRDAQNLQRQTFAVFELCNLIEQVKRSITKDYEVDDQVLTDEIQINLINKVIDEMLYALDANWKDSRAEFDAFRREVTAVLLLPRRLTRRWYEFRKPPLPYEPLKQSLELYVKENVDDLLDSLKKQVREHQAVSSRSEGREEIDRHAFVVVSGQGSQFKPLRQAIVDKCDEMGIGANHRYLMVGVPSKEACCRGVINFRTDDIHHMNPRELHGTYGCLARSVVTEPFKAFKMSDIKNGGKTSVSFETPGAYYLVFTPRSYDETLTSIPIKNDGSTAIIEVFFSESEFEIDYNEKDLRLSVNGKSLDLKTFGGIEASIYPKVWPEILQPEDE